MLQAHQIEDLIGVVSALDRDALVEQFRLYRGNFPIDFTADFLGRLPLERLRHIFVAMVLQNQRLPEIPTFTTPNAA
jgi:hypothetical protein